MYEFLDQLQKDTSKSNIEKFLIYLDKIENHWFFYEDHCIPQAYFLTDKNNNVHKNVKIFKLENIRKLEEYVGRKIKKDNVCENISLKGELKEGALSHTKPVDYHIAEHLQQPEVSPDMPLKDVFLLAADREKVSHDFYLALAGIHPEGKTKKLLQDLADQEMGHKKRVEYLYTEVAFPQTDGG